MKNVMPALNSKGGGLMEVLIALGVMAIISLGVMEMFDNMLSGSRTSQIQIARNQLAQFARLLFSHDQTVATSAALAQNAMLATCIYGTTDTTKPCIAKDNGTLLEQPLLMVSMDGVSYFSSGNGRPYDKSGSACGTDVPEEFSRSFPSCPLRLYTTFRAFCAGGTDTCLKADAVELSYRVDKNPDFPDSVPLKAAIGIAPYAPAGGSSSGTTADAANGVGNMSCMDTRGQCCINFGSKMRCFRMSDGVPQGVDVSLNLGVWRDHGLLSAQSPPLVESDFDGMRCNGVEGKGCINLGARCGSGHTTDAKLYVCEE